MRSKTSLAVGMVLASLSTQAGHAASCTTLADSGKFKNAFVCPVTGGAKVRAGDACAKEGGTFRAARGTGHFHNALDMNAPEGTGVVATKPGRVAVASAGWGAMGNAVIIDHEDGDYSIYGHLKDLKVAKGACVKAGDPIGTVGYTGNAQCLKDKGLSSHLHFAVIRAAAIGLADGNGPIAAASKNAQDWLDLAAEVFPGDNLDLGIKDPQGILQKVTGCLQ